ncbi:MAG: lipid-A-disaccharide synthase [Nitrospiraceae bacterium]|nr:MAG: lipid-A-disaccharide synthase [Nitrospiraceae bacterium]
MISAGEASGELYGALLSREVKKLWPGVEVFGIGGSRMEKEGVTLIAPISQVVGIIEAVKHLRKVKNTLKKAADALASKKPDVLVLIDYPDFNLMLAKHAKAAGIPVLYYVSPQIWAWRRNRVKKIAALADRMAVLFPFEVDYYKHTSLPCEFVGHPIAETINIPGTKETIKDSLGLDPLRGVVTLLPGSRPDEILRHQPIIKEVSEKLHHEFPDMQIVIPLTAESRLTQQLPDYIQVIKGRTSEAVACSEAAAVASGTATLETALAGTPMVVFYKVSRVSFLLAKMLIKVEFISLVNILSQKRVVMELLQNEAAPENIFSELKKILTDQAYRDEMVSGLKKISEIMLDKKPSRRVAAIIGEMTEWEVAHASL